MYCYGNEDLPYMHSFSYTLEYGEYFCLSHFLAVLSATAISSVPGGGAIGSAMIVSMLGLPPEAMGILILVGTLVDPLGTMINSTGDSVVSFLIARILEGSNWMTRHI